MSMERGAPLDAPLYRRPRPSEVGGRAVYSVLRNKEVTMREGSSVRVPASSLGVTSLSESNRCGLCPLGGIIPLAVLFCDLRELLRCGRCKADWILYRGSRIGRPRPTA